MSRAKVLLLIPPLTQLNTPYPSTAYLTGFLHSQGVACEQADLGIEMVLRLFSRAGLARVFNLARKQNGCLPDEAHWMLEREDHYLDIIEIVIAFLQGHRPDAATMLLRPGVLPQGPRFAGKTRWSRSISEEDRPKRWGTMLIEDLADFVQATVSPHFALSRYAEHIARSASSFDSLLSALAQPPTLTDELLLDVLDAHLHRVHPTLVGLSVPFPGNLYGAFRMAQAIKQQHPNIAVALGGGYANTELRRVNNPRVFDYVDFITLDDGERPLLSLVEHLEGRRPRALLCRTFYRERDRVVYANDPAAANFTMEQVGCPTYRGLDLTRYLTILDSTNPMHRLWSEGHWNKLTVAHGCYWKQCTFCDVGLDYIGRYEMTPTDRLIEQIVQLIEETGCRRFHFVDEAAPPAALKSLALGLLERKIAIAWWGNIRFEEAFTPDLCRLLAASGCIAVTAGLEAASDRLLKKMKKGITVDQTALVADAFRKAGILVHAYLMYGCPSETIQETIDSHERVRQLFAAGLIQSAFWHRFTATAHSPVGLAPSAHGLRILGPSFQGFAENDLLHKDKVAATPDWLGEGLRRSMLNYLEGRGLTLDVRKWFDHAVSRPRVSKTWVGSVINRRTTPDDPAMERRTVWLGDIPTYRTPNGRSHVRLSGMAKETTIALPQGQARWLVALLEQSHIEQKRHSDYPHIREAAESFPGNRKSFSQFLRGPVWKKARAAGLLLV